MSSANERADGRVWRETACDTRADHEVVGGAPQGGGGERGGGGGGGERGTHTGRDEVQATGAVQGHPGSGTSTAGPANAPATASRSAGTAWRSERVRGTDQEAFSSLKDHRPVTLLSPSLMETRVELPLAPYCALKNTRCRGSCGRSSCWTRQRLTVHQDRPALVRDARVDTEADRVVGVDLDRLDVLGLLVEARRRLRGGDLLAVVVAVGLGAHRVRTDRDGGQRRRLATGGQQEESAETAPRAATARRERSAVMAEGYRARPAHSPRGCATCRALVRSGAARPAGQATRGFAAPPRRAEASRPRTVRQPAQGDDRGPTTSPSTPFSGSAMPIAPPSTQATCSRGLGARERGGADQLRHVPLDERVQRQFGQCLGEPGDGREGPHQERAEEDRRGDRRAPAPSATTVTMITSERGISARRRRPAECVPRGPPRRRRSPGTPPRSHPRAGARAAGRPGRRSGTRTGSAARVGPQCG